MAEKTSQTNDGIRRRIGEFALLHFSQVCDHAADMGHSLIEDETSVALLPYDVEHRRGLLFDKIVARLDYCSAGLADLRAAGLLPGQENGGASDTGPGGNRAAGVGVEAMLAGHAAAIEQLGDMGDGEAVG